MEGRTVGKSRPLKAAGIPEQEEGWASVHLLTDLGTGRKDFQTHPEQPWAGLETVSPLTQEEAASKMKAKAKSVSGKK